MSHMSERMSALQTITDSVFVHRIKILTEEN